MKSSDRVIAVIQARTGSRRLPRKVLADVAGRPLIARVVQRVLLASEVDRVAVAIPSGSRDDALAHVVIGIAQEDPRVELHRAAGIRENDVLRRYVQAMADYRDAGAVLRVTADCPFVDPGLLNAMIRTWRDAPTRPAMVTNNVPPTFPHGLDAEVIGLWSLRLADRHATLPFDREHVSPWIHERVKARRFEAINLAAPADAPEGFGSLRLTVDYAEDLDLARAIYAVMGDRPFSTSDVFWLMNRRPDLVELMQRACARALDDGRLQEALRRH